MSKHYVLSCLDPDHAYLARIEYRDDSPWRFWIDGESFDDPPQTPLKAIAVMDRKTVMAELWLTPLPMMTRRLHAALGLLGVSHMDTYDVELTDKRTNSVIGGYLAFNLVGLVSMNDLDRTELEMFRLRESPDMVLVSQRVRDGLLEAGFGMLTFRPFEVH